MSHLINMMEQVKKIKSGIGAQSFLDEAYKILGNPIAMFDTEYSLVAHTEVVTDDPIWVELITHGTFGKVSQTFFAEEGFVEAVSNASKSVLLQSEKLKYDRISGKVFNKNNSHVSNLIIVACNKPFEEYDQIVFEAICKLMSKEISMNEFYQEYEQAHQETIINNLIEGTFDIKIDSVQAGILYDSLKSHLYIAVVDISECDSGHADVSYFRDLFKQIEPSYKYAVCKNYIVIIISTDDDILNVKKELSGLIKVFEQKNIYAGISSRFENLFEFKKYYMEAIKSLEYVVKCKCSQRIFPYNAGSISTMEQIELLENGLGIQYFLDVAPEIFGNPVLFHDMELNLLAYSRNVEIKDPFWQELIAYGTSSNDTIELFRTEGMIDLMDNIKGGAILTSDKFKYDHVTWRVYNNEEVRIGCISISCTNIPFSEDELVLFGTFSQKFSKEVGKIEFYNNYGQVYSGTIINRLISGKIDDYAFYSEDVGNLYDNLMDNLYLVVVDTTQCKSEQINITYFRELFNRLDTVNRYAFYSKYIIIIMSVDRISLNDNNEIDKLNNIFEQNDIYAGISNCFDDLYQLPRYYKEAVDALSAGMKKGERRGKHRIFQRGNTNDNS